MASSPASSPRLPSPPPMAEDQVGPPSPGTHISEEYSSMGANNAIDQAASRRIRPGTKAEDMLEGPPLVDLQDIDSAFQLTEHLKALHASHTRPSYSPTSIAAVDRSIALALAQPPPGIDRGIWLYELCRFLTQKANAMAVGLFADEPPCSSNTCPEMRASEWQYLCAAHDPPKSCCAIDYCCHTLDWSATQLTTSKLFPSRLALGTESATSTQQVRKMTEIFRRVYRIFAHAWFQHRDVFWRVENKTGIYVFFKTVCDEYKLIPEDNYTIPPEAEGIESTPVAERHGQPTLMRRDTAQRTAEEPATEPVGNVVTAAGNTTKRHRQGYSKRQSSVSTIIHEEVEEDEEGEEEDHDSPDAEEHVPRGRVMEVEPEQTAEHIPAEVDAPANDEPTAEVTVADENHGIPHFPVHAGSASAPQDEDPPAHDAQEETSEVAIHVEEEEVEGEDEEEGAAPSNVTADEHPEVESVESSSAEAEAGDAEEASKSVAD